jgi:hypothetical protein
MSGLMERFSWILQQTGIRHDKTCDDESDVPSACLSCKILSCSSSMSVICHTHRIYVVQLLFSFYLASQDRIITYPSSKKLNAILVTSGVSKHILCSVKSHGWKKKKEFNVQTCYVPLVVLSL